MPRAASCGSDGRTEAEALANVAEAIAEHLAAVEDLTAEGSASVREVEAVV